MLHITRAHAEPFDQDKEQAISGASAAIDEDQLDSARVLAQSVLPKVD